MRLVGVGVGVTSGLAFASALYAVLTWDQPHRAVLIAISVAALCDAGVIYLLRRRIGSSPHLDAIFAVWNVTHILAAGTAAHLDGGVTSPYVTILFVSVAFAAVSLPHPYVVGVAAVDIATLIAIAVTDGDWPASVYFTGASLAAVAFVGVAIAGERYVRLVAVEEARSEMLQRMARVIEFRDFATGAHVERMSEYSGLIAEQLGWNGTDADRLRSAAAMHDIGKIAVPDAILRKPGPLTADERLLVQHHTVVGWEMLTGSSSAELELAAEIALSHHERYDGGGYPNGLKGDEIPLAGRIVAVADVFDALTSDRVYRPALELEDALAIMRDGAGTHFDPVVFDAFEAALDRILGTRFDDDPGAPPFVGAHSSAVS